MLSISHSLIDSSSEESLFLVSSVFMLDTMRAESSAYKSSLHPTADGTLSTYIRNSNRPKIDTTVLGSSASLHHTHSGRPAHVLQRIIGRTYVCSIIIQNSVLNTIYLFTCALSTQLSSN